MPEPLEHICALEDLPERSSVKFTFRQGGEELEAFCIRVDGRVFAYLNECAHLPMSLDWDDNEFFAEDGNRLMCKTHGAVYEPGTGLCVEGPCPGRTLTAVPVVVRDGTVWRVGKKVPRARS